MCYNWRTNAGFYDVWHRFLPDIHQDQTVQNFISARPAWPGSRCTCKQERIGHDNGLHTVLASDIMLYILPFSSQNTSFAVQLKKKKEKRKSSKWLWLPVLWGIHSLPLYWTRSNDASFIQHSLETCWRACAGSFVSVLKVVDQVSHCYNTNKPSWLEQSLEWKKKKKIAYLCGEICEIGWPQIVWVDQLNGMGCL